MNRLNRARHLRRHQTDAESLFWSEVRDRRFLGLKWRRQVPIDRYIADFVCESEKLIVELDGSQHEDQKDYDQTRTETLAQYGYRTIRFWNDEIINHMSDVLSIIQECVGDEGKHIPSPRSPFGARTSPQGEVRD